MHFSLKAAVSGSSSSNQKRVSQKHPTKTSVLVVPYTRLDYRQTSFSQTVYQLLHFADVAVHAPNLKRCLRHHVDGYLRQNCSINVLLVKYREILTLILISLSTSIVLFAVCECSWSFWSKDAWTFRRKGASTGSRSRHHSSLHM